MEHFRELARAIALRDFDGAAIVLDLMIRDGALDYLDDNASLRAGQEIELGRSDASAIRARDGKVAVLKQAA